ncbi:sulfite exporter TauE/SafE family protein [Consotaella salsifontis]|uniref:Probable membrane transporter protein n=1 Tax=Consotaella salsifontis TaxID=1365950 RepID=A0A1T4SHR2_9HYPH|nr:sulfite exporter TauE/SafE family protein [Consotaella salsifontis]SKA27703.1 hypothetical protein SAMN05428963_1113 [Consotaella salsifontis]
MIPVFLLISAILALGSFVQGLTGFGLALTSVPLLSLVVGVKTAVPLAGLFGWLVTFPIVWAMREHIQWKAALVLFVGSLPGSWLGAEMLKRLPGEAILLAMGVVLVLSSIYALIAKGPVIKRAPTSATLLTGFFSGALGASVGEPGPPVIAYASLLPWSADQAKSTLVCFFMLQMAGAVFSFYQKDLLTAAVLTHFVQSIPAFIVGLVLGMTGYAMLQRFKINYHHLVHGCLVVIGAVLIVKSI